MRCGHTISTVSLSAGSKTSLQIVVAATVAAICRISAGAAASALTFSNINCHQRPGTTISSAGVLSNMLGGHRGRLGSA
jgi:hypothetical protein